MNIIFNSLWAKFTCFPYILLTYKTHDRKTNDWIRTKKKTEANTFIWNHTLMSTSIAAAFLLFGTVTVMGTHLSTHSWHCYFNIVFWTHSWLCWSCWHEHNRKTMTKWPIKKKKKKTPQHTHGSKLAHTLIWQIPLYGGIHWCPHPLLQHFWFLGQSLSWEHISTHSPTPRFFGHAPGFSVIQTYGTDTNHWMPNDSMHL